MEAALRVGLFFFTLREVHHDDGCESRVYRETGATLRVGARRSSSGRGQVARMGAAFHNHCNPRAVGPDRIVAGGVSDSNYGLLGLATRGPFLLLEVLMNGKNNAL